MTIFYYIRQLFSKKRDKALSNSLRQALPARMDATAKARTRELLSEYLAMKPLQPAVRERLMSRLVQRASPSERATALLTHNIQPMPFIIGLLLFSLSGGTAFAAEGALPGDTLYPIKVNVNEAVRGALAVSTESKAGWDVTLAERRLNEAAALATAQKLTAENRATIEAQIESHVRNANKHSEELESDDDFAAATEVSTRLNAVLRAHTDLLKSIRDNTADTDTRTELSAAIALLDTRSSDAAEAEHSSDRSFAASLEQRSEESMASALSGQRTAAAAKIANVERTLAKVASTSATTTSAYTKASAKLGDAKAALAAGDAAVSASSTTEAFIQFRSALKLAIQAKVYLSTSEHEEEYEQEHAREREHEQEMEQEHATSTTDSDTKERERESEREHDDDADSNDDSNHRSSVDASTSVRVDLDISRDDEDEDKTNVHGDSETKGRFDLDL